MRKQIALGAALALGFAGSALADGFSYSNLGFSYSNLEAGYTSVNLKGTSAKASGVGVSGSWGFDPSVSVFGGYQDLDVNKGGGSLKHLNLGLGLNWWLGGLLDLTSGLSYESVDTGPNASGYGLALGLRGRLSGSFELTGGVKYYDLNKGWSSQATFGVGARYYFTPALAVGADLWDQDDLGSSWVLSVRYDLGERWIK